MSVESEALQSDLFQATLMNHAPAETVAGPGGAMVTVQSVS